MTNKNLTLLCYFLAVMVLLVVGLINGYDIQACIEAGNSKDFCYQIINP